MVRVIMSGCGGKMGKVITELVAGEKEMEIVAGIDVADCASASYPVLKSLKECSVDADVVIDFSNAKGTDALLDSCVEKKLPCVLCTTGLSAEQIAHVERASEKTAILRSGNMSVGINLLLKLLRQAAPVLAEAGFDMEIVEKHHNQKIDAPSGTALMLADAISEELEQKPHYEYDRHSKRAKRDKNEIGIHAVRGGTIVGEHEVLFAGRDELISISHSARSKEIFAVGSVNAAVFLCGQPAGLYAMKDFVNAK